MTFGAGPSTLVEWLLLVAGLSTFAVYVIGLQKFFIQPAVPNRAVAFFQDSNIALAAIHCVGILSRRPPGVEWTIAGIALYVAAMALFLAALDASRGTLLARAFVDDHPPDRLVTNGVFRLVRHPVYLSYALGWAAAPVATHSPTLGVTAGVMILCFAVAARREDVQLAERFGPAYHAYRRWWR